MLVLEFFLFADSLCVPVFCLQALVDGAGNGVVRGIVNFKRLAITDLKVGIQRGARSKTVEKLFKEADIASKWGKTTWAKRTEARTKRVAMNDFDRFKAMLAKKNVRLMFRVPTLLPVGCQLCSNIL